MTHFTSGRDTMHCDFSSTSQIVTLFIIAQVPRTNGHLHARRKTWSRLYSVFRTHVCSNLSFGRINRTKVWSLSRVFGYGWGALHITRMVHTVINTETVA